MKTTHTATLARPFTVVAAIVIAVLAAGGDAAAQERPPALLNTLEVQTLVARGDPVDNDRLFAHFRVLWERSLANAEQHESMALRVAGNPNRSIGGGTPQHRTQLATLERQSAKTLREVALYHKQLAEGVRATLPPGAASFEGGAGAPDPTPQELDLLAARARSRTDHLALEEYLRTVAARHARTANEQVMQALTFRGGRTAQAAVHHEHLAGMARDAARRAIRAAEMQRQYAVLAR